MTVPAPHLVRVALGERAYHVEVGVGLLGSLGERVRSALGILTGETPVPPELTARRAVPPQRAFLVVDSNLPAGLTDAATGSLDAAGFAVTVERVVATEANKSVASLERLLTALAASRHERADPVIALGGGIVGDLAGFAAATYRRGVPVIQCPTTLLAMADASVGGKTGVNLIVGDSLLKNMAGAFWQPRLVVADVAALRSLGDRSFRAGLAECLKHSLIAGRIDPTLADWTQAALPSLHCRDEVALVELVARNVAVKARFVEEDEREGDGDDGGRALLNLGHTFAHAIETITHLTPDDDPASAPLLHGEAVALGLIAASATAESLGRTDAGATDRLRAIVADAGLPTTVAGLPESAALLASMAHDKKVAGGRLRLVLPTGAGLAEVVTDPPEPAVVAGLDAIRAGG